MVKGLHAVWGRSSRTGGQEPDHVQGQATGVAFIPQVTGAAQVKNGVYIRLESNTGIGLAAGSDGGGGRQPLLMRAAGRAGEEGRQLSLWEVSGLSGFPGLLKWGNENRFLLTKASVCPASCFLTWPPNPFAGLGLPATGLHPRAARWLNSFPHSHSHEIKGALGAATSEGLASGLWGGRSWA